MRTHALPPIDDSRGARIAPVQLLQLAQTRSDGRRSQRFRCSSDACISPPLDPTLARLAKQVALSA
jgi:hypothetical protein